MDKTVFRDDMGATVLSDDHISGQRIDKITGEVEEVAIIVAPVGSRVITPTQQIIIDKRKKKQEKDYLRSKRHGEKKPQFTGVSTVADFSDLSPANITRLIYLSTYLKYHNSELRSSERRKITKDMLPEILGVGERTVQRFLREVSPSYVQIDDEGILSLNPDVFTKGRMKRNLGFYIKVFEKGMQNLYNSVPRSKHKQLGYIFNMLPYVNIEHNILCQNTDEISIDSIEPMTMAEFCAEIGYDYKHVDRLHKAFKSLTFDVGDGNYELFCSIIENKYTGKELMIINPRVFYSGTNEEAVAEFGAFYN